MVEEWIKDKARKLGIDTDKMNKLEAIRAIQQKEGYRPCYGFPRTFDGFKMIVCDRMDCCWRSNCLGMYSGRPKPSFVFNVVDK